MQKRELQPDINDNLSIYLRQASEYPRLTKENEQTLFLIIEQGKKAETELKEGVCDIELEEVLCGKIQEAKNIRKKVAESNVFLVVSIAKYFQGRGLELEDLIQYGNIGLMTAIKKFEWRKGYKFSTYAGRWIMQALSRAIGDNSRTIRLPNHMHLLSLKISKAESKLLSLLGRNPSVQEIAEYVNASVEHVTLIQEIDRSLVSLDMPIHGENDEPISSFILDNSFVLPEEALEIKSERQEKLHEFQERWWSYLEDYERQAISLSFGLGGSTPKSLKEIGRVLGVSENRVMEIIDTAIWKMKHKTSTVSKPSEERQAS